MIPHPFFRSFLLFFAFPVFVFVLHFVLLKFLLLSLKKKFLIFFNAVLYPLMICGLCWGVSVLLGASGRLWLSLLGGFGFYYVSVFLGLVPVFSVLFRESEVEFFLLAAGSLMGSSSSSLKDFVGLLSFRVCMALAAGILIGYVISLFIRSLVCQDSSEEARIWAVSAGCFVMALVLSLFYWHFLGF